MCVNVQCSCIHMHGGAAVFMHGGRRLALSVFLDSSLPYILSQSLLQAQSLMVQLVYLGSLFQGPLSLSSHHWDYRQITTPT